MKQVLFTFLGAGIGILAFWFLQPKNVDVDTLIKKELEASKQREYSLTVLLNAEIARSADLDMRLREQTILAEEAETRAVYANATHTKLVESPIRMLVDSVRTGVYDSLYPGYNRLRKKVRQY